MVELRPEACGQKKSRLRQPMKWARLLLAGDIQAGDIQVGLVQNQSPSREHPTPGPKRYSKRSVDRQVRQRELTYSALS
jgi:hypothetical protein